MKVRMNDNKSARSYNRNMLTVTYEDRLLGVIASQVAYCIGYSVRWHDIRR